MSRHAGGFRGNALHQVAVADDSISKMVDDLESGPIVARGEIRFCDGHSHAITEALTERPGGHFHSGSQFAFRMAGREAFPLAKMSDLVKRQIITGKMMHDIV